MGTLADFRAALRLDLNDPTSPSQRFSDTDLNRAVTRAVAELSIASPRLTDTEYPLPIASRTVSLPALTFASLTDIEQIEHPYGLAGASATNPPTLIAFHLAPDRASVLLLASDTPAAGTRIRIRWSSPHSVLEASTTVPTDLDYLIARGAYAFACLAYSTPAADNFKYDDGATVAGVDDSMIPTAWRTRATEVLQDFRTQLTLLRQRRATSQLATWPLPDAALASQLQLA
jgi:hypothetical protein